MWAFIEDAPLPRPVAVRPVSTAAFAGVYLTIVLVSLLAIEMIADDSRSRARREERRHRQEIEDIASRIRSGT